MYPLNSILKKFTRDLGLEGSAALKTIRDRWNDLVGPTIATHASPDIIRGKTLTIVVDTPQWMHHLGFYREEILHKLEAYGVREIRFRLGRPSSHDTTGQYKELPLTDEDSRYIEESIKIIKDQELREKFRTLFIHGLTRSRK